MYNHAPEDYICPFCLLIRGISDRQVHSVQSDIIYHDDAITAFIGLHHWQKNPCNVIIVPNEHFENIYDLPIYYAHDIHRLARLIALALKAVYACQGVSTRQHNEPAGNQDVWHYHLHVTPRSPGDGLYTAPRLLLPVSQRAAHAESLKHALSMQKGLHP